MNAYAYYIVNHHLDYLLEESARNQRVQELFPQPTLRARVASPAAGIRRVFDPIDFSAPALPNLDNYPFGG